MGGRDSGWVVSSGAVEDCNRRTLESRTRTVLSRVTLLSSGFRGTMSVVCRYRNGVVIANINGDKRINTGVTTALTSANAPTFCVGPLSMCRNSLNIVASGSIILTLDGDNRASRLLHFVPVILRVGIPVVSVANGPGSLLTGCSGRRVAIGIGGRTYPLGLTPADDAATTLTVNSTLTVTLVRIHRFGPHSFTRFRPNNRLNGHLLAATRSIVHDRSVPVVPGRVRLNRTVVRIDGNGLKLKVSLSRSRHIVNLVASKSVHHTVRG